MYRNYVLAVRRMWLTSLAALLICLAGGFAACLLTPVRFTAESRVFVSVQSATSVTDLSQGGAFTQNIVASYAEVATTPIVLDPVIKQLGLTDSASELAKRVTAVAPSDTVLINLAATDPSPSGAAKLVNAIADRMQRVVADISPQSSDGSAVKITAVTTATPPDSPSAPNVAVTLLAAALVGLIIAFGVPYLRLRLDTRVRTVEEVEAATGASTLGRVPTVPQLHLNPIQLVEAPASPFSEAVRSVGTNLHYASARRGSQLIVLTSSIAEEGKSTTSVNLAVALAKTRSVALIDADLRRPRAASLLGLSEDIGLSDVLVGDVALDTALQPWGKDGMVVLPAGHRAPNPSELLQSPVMDEVLQALTNRFDVVLVDSPPLLPVVDAALLAARADGVVLCVAAGRVHRRQVADARETLRRVNAKLAGFVLTLTGRQTNDTYGVSYQYYRDA